MRRPLAILLLAVGLPLLTLAVGGIGSISPSLPPPMLDAELGVPLGAPLISVVTRSPLAMDGAIEAAWDQAPLLLVSLRYGLHGREPAGDLELRSLHDSERVYLLARWATETAGGEPDVWRNLLTVHWRLVDAGLVSGESTGSDGMACTVACHTATADGQGQLVGIRNETIPPGLEDDLPAGGSWAEGMWTVEWSRLRTSQSPYDQDMTDPTRGYRFFVKLFQDMEGRADPVSYVHELRFSP